MTRPKSCNSYMDKFQQFLVPSVSITLLMVIVKNPLELQSVVWFSHCTSVDYSLSRIILTKPDYLVVNEKKWS